MIRLVSLLMLCGSVTLTAAKIALIPTSPELIPLADQVLAEMTTEPGMEFVERTNIAKILAERKLTASGLTGENIVSLDQTVAADIFAVISAKPAKGGATASGLIVYSARNGFRLVNTNLPEANTVSVIVKCLKQSVKTLAHPDKLLWLSVAAVREVGIPERLKYRAAYIAVELERRLGGIPGVVVLERDNLGSVNQERELTGRMFKLMPSARLVRLEFTPGKTADTADLKLRLTNASGHELFRWRKSDCFADEKTTMMQGLAVMAAYLEAAMPELVSSEAEAARFFAEYQFLSRLGDYVAARRKLDSAIALNPHNQNYRLHILKLNRAEGRDASARDAIAALERNIAVARSIEEEFPALKGYYSHDYFDWEFTNKHSSLTSSDLAKLMDMASIYRPKYLALLRWSFYKFDLTDGIESIDEWNKYNRYCLDAGRFSLFWNADDWCGWNFKTAVQNLELSRKFFSRHPELLGKSAAADWLFAMAMQYGIVNNNPDCPVAIAIAKAMNKMLLDCDDYIVRATDHPLSSVRFCALKLDLLRKTIRSNYDEAEFRKNFQSYCRQQQLSCGNKIPDDSDDYVFRIFFNLRCSSMEKIMIEIRRQELEQVRNAAKSAANGDRIPQVTLQSLINQFRLETTPERKAIWVVENEPLWRQYENLFFTDPEVRDFFQDIIRLVRHFVLTNNYKLLQKLEASINHGVVIEKLSTVNDDTASSITTIKSAVVDGNRLFLLLKSNRMVANEGKYMRVANFRIVTADIATGRLHVATGWSDDQLMSPRICSEMLPPPFAIGDDMAVTGGDSSIMRFDLKTGSVFEIKDVPGGQILALSIMEGRIYAFAGVVNNNVARETVLFSCRPDGFDRRIHLSTSRDDKQCELDRAKPFIVYSMLPDLVAKRLIFNAASPNNSGTINGLWEFIPVSGNARCLFERKWRDVDPIMTRHGKQVFFSFFHEDFCVYDLDADKGEIFFSIANANARNHLRVKFRAAQGIFYRSPFFARPNQIWFGGDCGVKLLTLPDIRQSPLILVNGMDNVRLLYPYPDGRSALVVDHCSLFKITPK